uniref:DUF674 family protein n=1 Tax=Cajanus cajan TaxID=3821 RepID=A0A151UD58_CAJCA|nr:hypothetical protein KK1_021488 [Cajanus cajan]
MASNKQEEKTIPLRYWVDERQNTVVIAEAKGDFVDALFSLLTLPLGTIIRLGNKFEQPVEIGCINNLYQSVQDLLSLNDFWNKMCKEMLLSPRNPLEASCQRLKVNVDDTQPTKYFMCHSCSKSSNLWVSTFDGARCYCGKLMRKEMELLVEEPKEDADGGNSVFVKGDAMFLIHDDLRVLRSSPSDSVPPFVKHRHKDLSKMTEKSQNVGMKEVILLSFISGRTCMSCLFKTIILVVESSDILNSKHLSLTSETPLSDVFVPNRESKSSYSFSPDSGPIHWEGSVEIKVIVSKSENKVKFVEADGNFVDFLVSFLTTPLGSILNLMNGKLSLGSIDNLYTSVKKLNPSWFKGSSNKSLLNPRVAPQFGCKSNPLNALQEEDTPKYWYGTVEDNKGSIRSERKMISKVKNLLRDPADTKLFEPRCFDGAREPAVGFMKRPCLFIVKDDLQVIPITTTSSITHLQQLENVQLDDLEEHWVEIRKAHEVIFTFTIQF